MHTWNSEANAIFLNASEIQDPDQRRDFVDQACQDNLQLRECVETLLSASAKAGSFLEGPVPAADATVNFVASGTESESTARLSQPAILGSQIGPYKLLQELGEGGMGTVYMAEQEQPVRRKIALKLIKPGMDSQEVLARFDAERQALALMEHPNIARVFDAGTTDNGRPYFVMELVKGVPITQYCDEHNLTTNERLELFVPVCRAIQHAHQKGIIHRDIKPSNVLVASYDGQPVPKVIDFGVAKATGQQLTEKTLFTAFGGIVGTLEYMSPEQAAFNALDIDTRSDVYALGVLLYELLTGSPPLTRQRLKETAIMEALRLIREEEPPKPSMRLSSSDGLPSLAAFRKSEPAQLPKLMRGELDWIAMKSLEKDRARRYETASGLARDVERYLRDEPVEAGPPSATYRLRKLAHRYRNPLRVAATIAVLLVGSTVVSAWMAYRAMQAEAAAVAQRVIAEDATERAKQEAERARDQERRLRLVLAQEVNTVEPTEVSRAEGVAPLISVPYSNQPQLEMRARLTERLAASLKLTHLSAAQFADRAHTYGQLGMFEDAAAAFGEAMQLDPADSWNWFYRGYLLAYLGKADLYREHGKVMLERLGTQTDLEVRARSYELTVQICSLLPGQFDAQHIRRLSKEALDEKLKGGPNLRPWFYLSYGIAQYRCGEYQPCVESVTTYKNNNNGNYPANAVAELILAMAYHQLGNTSASSAWYGIAAERIVNGMQDAKRLETDQALAYPFENWLRCQIHLREAEALLGKLPTPPPRVVAAAPPARVSADATSTSSTAPGNAQARRGDFPAAADAFTVQLKLRPADSLIMVQLLTLLAENGNLEAYREHCHALLELHAQTTNIVTARRLAKACLLAPLPDADRDAAVKLADLALTGSTVINDVVQAQLGKALAEFRLGHHAEAISFAQKVIDAGSAPGRSTFSSAGEASAAYAIQAAAKFKLDQVNEARAAMQRANDALNVAWLSPQRTDLGELWRDVVIAHVLVREAENLINGSQSN
jgi:serine/threonine protein kinase